MTTITCCVTGATREVEAAASGEPSLPRGWKRVGGKEYSAEGFSRAFLTRSVFGPVAGMCDENGGMLHNEEAAQRWKEFLQAVYDSAANTSRLSNFCLREIARVDNTLPIVQKSEDPKPVLGYRQKIRLPPMPKMPNLYKMLRVRFPTLDSQSLSMSIQNCLSLYKKFRWEMLALGSASLPTVSNPAPIPIPAKDYRVFFPKPGNHACIRVRLEGQVFYFRLRGGRGKSSSGQRKKGACGPASTTSALRAVVRGDYILGAMKIVLQRSGGGHQNGGRSRSAQGANKRATRVMCHFAVSRPRSDAGKGGDGPTMRVRTGKDFLWEAVIAGRETPWLLHEEHVRRGIARHAARMQALSDDTKFERRRPRREMANIGDYRKRLCDRQHRVLADFIHKATKMLTGLARRSGVARVEYNDSEHGWAMSFPWFRLKQTLKNKLDEFNIAFVESKPTEDICAGDGVNGDSTPDDEDQASGD